MIFLVFQSQIYFLNDIYFIMGSLTKVPSWTKYWNRSYLVPTPFPPPPTKSVLKMNIWFSSTFFFWGGRRLSYYYISMIVEYLPVYWVRHNSTSFNIMQTLNITMSCCSVVPEWPCSISAVDTKNILGGPSCLESKENFLDYILSRLAKTASPKVNFKQ